MRLLLIWELLTAKEPSININGTTITFLQDKLLIKTSVIHTEHDLMFLGCTDEYVQHMENSNESSIAIR